MHTKKGTTVPRNFYRFSMAKSYSAFQLTAGKVLGLNFLSGYRGMWSLIYE